MAGAPASFAVAEARELRAERSFSDDGRYEWIFRSERMLLPETESLADENAIIKWTFVDTSPWFDI
jgi:hypothetical protein